MNVILQYYYYYNNTLINSTMKAYRVTAFLLCVRYNLLVAPSHKCSLPHLRPSLIIVVRQSAALVSLKAKLQGPHLRNELFISSIGFLPTYILSLIDAISVDEHVLSITKQIKKSGDVMYCHSSGWCCEKRWDIPVSSFTLIVFSIISHNFVLLITNAVVNTLSAPLAVF